jgi:hypothetical protein
MKRDRWLIYWRLSILFSMIKCEPVRLNQFQTPVNAGFVIYILKELILIYILKH